MMNVIDPFLTAYPHPTHPNSTQPIIAIPFLTIVYGLVNPRCNVTPFDYLHHNTNTILHLVWKDVLFWLIFMNILLSVNGGFLILRNVSKKFAVNFNINVVEYLKKAKLV